MRNHRVEGLGVRGKAQFPLVASAEAISLHGEEHRLELSRKDHRACLLYTSAAAAFYGVTDISYDQLVFFLHGCLPLLYTVDDGGHPLLPLAEGLIAPAIYEEAEKRLNTDAKEVEANHMTQSLTLTGISDVVADTRSARAAAYARGYVTVTVGHDSTTIFPWRAQVVLQANPVSRLNPYPFYLAELTAKVGPDALAWDRTHSSALNP